MTEKRMDWRETVLTISESEKAVRSWAFLIKEYVLLLVSFAVQHQL